MVSQKSKIEWTERTWNPVRGCSMAKGSETGGCLNCYAARQASRGFTQLMFRNPDGTYERAARMTDSGPRFTGRVELQPHMLDIPLRRHKPTTYFVNSMSDLFHESLPDEAIDQVLAVGNLCHQHTLQILTKRAARMLKHMGEQNAYATVAHRVATHASNMAAQLKHRDFGHAHGRVWPLPNVWLGVSCEDRKNLYRIDLLRKTPAAVRFLSLEPLLEDLGTLDLTGIHWVIVGGESGPGARPMHPDWVCGIRDQCVAAGVPFFFKQWGAFRPVGNADPDSDDCDQRAVETANVDRTLRVWPDGGTDNGDTFTEREGGWFMEPVGKKAAGRLLDGHSWNQMPKAKR